MKYFSCIYSGEKLDSDLDIQSMQRTLYRHKSSLLPPSPQTAADVQARFEENDVMQKYGRTLTNENELASDFYRGVHIGETFSFVVFASQKIVDAIVRNIPVEQRKYLMDATFKICPFGNFTQLLIIYIEYVESVLLFSFLDKKFLFIIFYRFRQFLSFLCWWIGKQWRNTCVRVY